MNKADAAAPPPPTPQDVQLLTEIRDLLKNKVPVLHFYTLSKPNVIYNVLKQLF